MALTHGEILFYGGILGLAVTAIAAVIVTAILAGSRKRLRKKLDREYGKSE